MKAKKPLIAVVGETASGKSGVAMEAARRFNGEIIAADSRTIYKGMDIGTAKPTKEDQEEITHHCLDLVEPGEHFTAAQFKEAALRAIADIESRGKLPIMVGGTGLYADSVLFDFQFAEVGDADAREELLTLSNEELYKKVIQLGGEHVDKNNPRHMIRFIETGGTRAGDNTMRDDALVVAISRTRNVLRSRIEERVEQMFKAGLRREVDELVNKYGWDSEALTGIGYREFRGYYDGQKSMTQVKKDIVQNTIKYAKRQRTWFKRNLKLEQFESAEEALNRVNKFMTDYK